MESSRSLRTCCAATKECCYRNQKVIYYIIVSTVLIAVVLYLQIEINKAVPFAFFSDFRMVLDITTGVLCIMALEFVIAGVLLSHERRLDRRAAGSLVSNPDPEAMNESVLSANVPGPSGENLPVPTVSMTREGTSAVISVGQSVPGALSDVNLGGSAARSDSLSALQGSSNMNEGGSSETSNVGQSAPGISSGVDSCGTSEAIDVRQSQPGASSGVNETGESGSTRQREPSPKKDDILELSKEILAKAAENAAQNKKED